MAGQARAERPRIYAITGARIVTAPGHVIDNGTVILRDGLIEAVGSKLAVPADAEQISAGRNSTVYPAFIDAASGVGLDAAAAPAGASRPAAEPKARGASHELKAVHPEDAVLERVDFSHASLAIAILELLSARGGVERSRMSIGGYADVAPVESNETPEGRARNRRVDIVVLNENGQAAEPSKAGQ